jgi:hypothetical protein
MVGRIRNRRELRKQADQAEQAGGDANLPAAPDGGNVKAGAPRAARAKRARPKKAPPRLRARWGIFDGGMKQVAIFDYNHRAAADEKLASLLARNEGAHYLQIVKEPIPEAEALPLPAVE